MPMHGPDFRMAPGRRRLRKGPRDWPWIVAAIVGVWLAEAFNTMSESLRRTLDSLARRESLAAVGEFAASLSHEVRNPLTAMRLDLQRVEEKLDPGSPLHVPLRRALRGVDRLQHTVSGALRVAVRHRRSARRR